MEFIIYLCLLQFIQIFVKKWQEMTKNPHQKISSPAQVTLRYGKIKMRRSASAEQPGAARQAGEKEARDQPTR